MCDGYISRGWVLLQGDKNLQLDFLCQREMTLYFIKENKAEIAPIHNDDLRFKTWNDIEKPESKAVVLMMMDTSDG